MGILVYIGFPAFKMCMYILFKHANVCIGICVYKFIKSRNIDAHRDLS